MDIGIGEFDLLRHRIIGTERGQDSCCRHGADRKFCGPIQKLAFGYPAMGIEIVEFEKFLRKILRRQTCHGQPFLSKKASLTQGETA